MWINLERIYLSLFLKEYKTCASEKNCKSTQKDVKLQHFQPFYELVCVIFTRLECDFFFNKYSITRFLFLSIIFQQKMKNLTLYNMTNCTEDFFCGVFENRWSKICFMTFTVIAIPVVLLLLYSIIWYERFGLDVKRTIVNKLTSSFCWIAIQFVIFVNIPDFGRYLTGPYSENFCL